MGSTKFIFLISILFIISYGQTTNNQNNLNLKRKLELDINETILIGFDYYREKREGTNLSISFDTYYMIKHNSTDTNDFIKEISKDSFSLSSKITGDSDPRNVDFICNRDRNQTDNRNKLIIIKYDCSTNLKSTFYPKRINLNLTSIDFSNNIKNPNISPFAYSIQSNLVNIKDIKIFDFFDCTRNFIFLKNARIIQSKGNYFKIRGTLSYLSYYSYDYDDNHYYNCYYYGNDYDQKFKSKNIKLILMNNELPATIQCEGYYAKDKEDDENYYYLETTGINPEINGSLQYAIANFTKKNYTIMLDFQNYNDSWIYKSQQLFKKTSGGLSTGGIIAIIIPCILILLGTAALAYFLIRKPSPIPSPHLKNMANNNTIGVASSEAVVPK